MSFKEGDRVIYVVPASSSNAGARHICGVVAEAFETWAWVRSTLEYSGDSRWVGVDFEDMELYRD